MSEKTNAIIAEIRTVICGKDIVILQALAGILSGGHVLIEDVPGVGKTTMALAFSRAMGLDYGRVQFTPDVLPSDITGFSVYDKNTQSMKYQPGSVFHNLFLADELNRASSRTQSALLEAMEEGQVTVDGKRYLLPEPFMVIATQNPIGFLGTYPLPEAQLDRFMMKLSVGYPPENEEIRLIHDFLDGKNSKLPESVCTKEEILALREEVKKVTISESVIRYIQEITDRTRKEERFIMGASPRAMLFLIAAARAKAFLCKRSFVLPDDVKAVAVNVLHHRMALTSESRIKNEDVDGIIKSLILKVKVPME